MTERIEPADWGESEWAEDGASAYQGGVVADVFPSELTRGVWSWTVRATSAVSEWPEYWDGGEADSQELAMLAAEKALAKAVASYAPAFERRAAERERERAELIADAGRSS